MSGFAFNQIDPETTGQVVDMEVPFSKYLKASWDQGFGGTFKKIWDATELDIEERDDTQPMLSVDELNKNYPGVEWDQPKREGAARLIYDKHQMDKELSFYLTQDNHSIAAGLVGQGTSMIASMLNPLDFALMFMPVVGEATKLGPVTNIRELGFLGTGGAIREGFARGLITREALQAGTRFPQLAESVIQGAAFMAMVEPINQYVAAKYKEDAGNPLLNIATGAGVAAGMHGVLKTLGLILSKMPVETLQAMFQKGMDDFAKGKDIEVSALAKVDKSYIDEQLAAQEALAEIEWNRINGETQNEPKAPGKSFEQKIQEIFNSRLQALRQELLPKAEKPTVPETSRELEAQQFSSVLDEIRQRNLRTKEQIQKGFPKAQLSREEAAVLRRQAWHEEEVKAQQTQNILDLVEQTKNENFIGPRQIGAKRAARLEAERNMPNLFPPEEVKLPDLVKPEDQTIAKVEEQTTKVEKKVKEKVKKQIKKQEDVANSISAYTQDEWDLLAEELASAADIYAQSGSGRGSMGTARNYDLIDEIQNFMDWARKEHSDLSINDAWKQWKEQSEASVGMLRKIKSLLNDVKPKEVANDPITKAGLVPKKGKLGKQGWFTSEDPRLNLSVQIDNNSITLNYIGITAKGEKGKGLGTETINKIKTLADETNKPIYLKSSAADEGMQGKLDALYEKLGFKRIKDNDFVYEPKTKEQPLNPGGALKDLPKELQDKSNAVKDAMKAEFEALKKKFILTELEKTELEIKKLNKEIQDSKGSDFAYALHELLIAEGGDLMKGVSVHDVYDAAANTSGWGDMPGHELLRKILGERAEKYIKQGMEHQAKINKLRELETYAFEQRQIAKEINPEMQHPQTSLKEKLEAEGKARMEMLKKEIEANKPKSDIIKSSLDCLGEGLI